MNGTITEVDNVTSTILGDSRSIWVYTPPSYAENADETFPVAYFQDGQNLFYANLSFGGVTWNLQGAMDQGALDGTRGRSRLSSIEQSECGQSEGIRVVVAHFDRLSRQDHSIRTIGI